MHGSSCMYKCTSQGSESVCTHRRPTNRGPFEWKVSSISGCRDPRGDDDGEIVIRQGGTVEVEYRQATSGC